VISITEGSVITSVEITFRVKVSSSVSVKEIRLKSKKLELYHHLTAPSGTLFPSLLLTAKIISSSGCDKILF
jgi:hypothetical protein